MMNKSCRQLSSNSATSCVVSAKGRRPSTRLCVRPRVVVCNNTLAGQEATAVARKPKGMQEHFQAIVDVLLFRAASRVERGVATCLECKGSGQCVCTNCKGAGVTNPVKRSTLAHSGPRSQTLLGQEKGDQWLVTNRCLKCRGMGNATCSTCDGTGLRAPPIIPARLSTRKSPQV